MHNSSLPVKVDVRIGGVFRVLAACIAAGKCTEEGVSEETGQLLLAQYHSVLLGFLQQWDALKNPTQLYFISA